MIIKIKNQFFFYQLLLVCGAAESLKLSLKNIIFRIIAYACLRI